METQKMKCSLCKDSWAWVYDFRIEMHHVFPSQPIVVPLCKSCHILLTQTIRKLEKYFSVNDEIRYNLATRNREYLEVVNTAVRKFSFEVNKRIKNKEYPNLVATEFQDLRRFDKKLYMLLISKLVKLAKEHKIKCDLEGIYKQMLPESIQKVL